MAKNSVIVLVLVALVSYGHCMNLLRARRQSNDNENADNTLEDRYGYIIAQDWAFPGFNPFPFPGQNPRSTTTSTTQRSTGNTVQGRQRCMRNCPVTSEYNPVCGTDNVTYSNPGKLSCAQACGVNVNLMRSAPCPTAVASQ